MADLRSLLQRIIDEGRSGQTDRCLTLETPSGAWVQLTWDHLNAMCPGAAPTLPGATLAGHEGGTFATYTWDAQEVGAMEQAVSRYLAEALSCTAEQLTLTGDEIL